MYANAAAIASARATCPRRLPRLHTIIQQRRWARVRDVRFVATQQASSGVTDRYRQKLEQKVRETGVGNVDELKEVYKDKIADMKKKAAVPGMTAPLGQAASSSPAATAPSQAPAYQPQASQAPPSGSPAAQPRGSPTGAKVPGVKTLSSFLDVSKTMTLPQREIEAIWRLRHAQNPSSLCAAIPTSTWENIQQTARKHPLFVLPGLPKTAQILEEGAKDAKEVEEAAPIHLLQWTFPSPTTATVIFTHLAEYKLRGEYAQPHTTLTHHLDLAEAKGLVLSEGMVIDGRGVNMDEAKWLVMNMQKFYNVGDAAERGESSDVGRQLKARRLSLVERFARGDESFRIEELVEETERMG